MKIKYITMPMMCINILNYDNKCLVNYRLSLEVKLFNKNQYLYLFIS